METLNKSPEKLKKGDAINYNGIDWTITDRSIYKGSKDYQEVQWTLYNQNVGERYLVRSEENKGGSYEYIWVFTKPFNIEVVEYESPSGTWALFKEDEFVDTPPSRIKYDNIIFIFEGETSGKAKDDDGLMVKKLTWDYYDSSGKRNLAIEVWKEQDRDYPEAYDGIVIEPVNIRILQSKEAQSMRRSLMSWQKEIGWSSGIVLFLFMSGVPLDVGVAFAVPIVSIYMVVTRYATVRLCIASILVWLAIAVLVFFTHFSAPYWLMAGYGIVLIMVVSRLTALTDIEGDGSNYSLISFSGLLPALWIYSFIMYFKFAPGPHSAGQFLITCILPLLPVLVGYALSSFLENQYGTT